MPCLKTHLCFRMSCPTALAAAGPWGSRLKVLETRGKSHVRGRWYVKLQHQGPQGERAGTTVVLFPIGDSRGCTGEREGDGVLVFSFDGKNKGSRGAFERQPRLASCKKAPVPTSCCSHGWQGAGVRPGCPSGTFPHFFCDGFWIAGMAREL